MWTISSAFREALKQPIQEVRVRMDILDTDFKRVLDISSGGRNQSLMDGTVELDTSRGTRRTAVISLVNEDGEFSPTNSWGGLFYVNRLIRLYRGLVIGMESNQKEVIEYIPIGTFMVDRSETLVERNMSTVILAGSDLWKKLNKSQYVEPTTYAKNRSINGVINEIADDAGVTKLALDPLSNRTTQSKELQAAVRFEKGETRGEALQQICKAYSLDVFFNPMGTLVTEDFREPRERPLSWTFGEGDESSMAYMLRGITDDDRLYNHVYVTGTGDEEHIYTAEKKNTDPLSPININRIGDRVYRMESGILASQDSVNKAATTLFYSHSLLSQVMSIEAICNPAFEGNDVVKINDPSFNEVNNRFLLETFNIPMLTSKQKLTMNRVINLA